MAKHNSRCALALALAAPSHSLAVSPRVPTMQLWP
jgi:hypothetical protein